MTSAQTALDILGTIPAFVPCCDHKQEVSTRTIAALRDSVQNAVEEERHARAVMLRLLPLTQQHYDRMRGENAANPNSVTDHWLAQANELLQNLNAILNQTTD